MIKKKVMFGEIGARLLDTDAGLDLELQVGHQTYKYTDTPFRKGEHSTIHRGTNSSGKPVLLKIAKSENFNEALKRELRIIRFFQQGGPGKRAATNAQVGKFLPKILSSTTINDRLVIVMPYDEDIISVETIHSAYGGLKPQDAAWVARRILAQVIAAEMGEMVHGSILPPHVLVNRVNHDPVHIGWAHAVDPAHERITNVVTAYKDFYPPEVFQKRRPDRRTDIYMAGQTIMYVLGVHEDAHALANSVPAAMAHVITKCTRNNPSNRYQRGAEALSALTEAVRGIWGTEFRPLEEA